MGTTLHMWMAAVGLISLGCSSHASLQFSDSDAADAGTLAPSLDATGVDDPSRDAGLPEAEADVLEPAEASTDAPSSAATVCDGVECPPVEGYPPCCGGPYSDTCGFRIGGGLCI